MYTKQAEPEQKPNTDLSLCLSFSVCVSPPYIPRASEISWCSLAMHLANTNTFPTYIYFFPPGNNKQFIGY